MTLITHLTARRLSRTGPRQPEPAAPRLHLVRGGPTAPQQCCDDIAERSLSLWQDVLTAVDRGANPPPWVPGVVWNQALAGAATDGPEQLSDIEGRLGVIEDLTYREASDRHRFGCARPHTRRASAADTWNEDLVGFRLRTPEQSVS